MGDEEVGEVELLLQVLKEVEDLGPHRDVEGAHGLVCHHEAGVEGQGAGYADALALAAGEGVDSGTCTPASGPRAQELGDPVLELLPRGDLVDLEGLAHDLEQRHARVEG